ncbi:MAG: beta-ketoacyl synthase N-terminal-like domain-containing protein [Thermoanaerobaculia bacterium]|nr:beta-ketoacyl synthase N-terminal-like domain-containing protein [Thermoanaerobaculia bacterium]
MGCVGSFGVGLEAFRATLSGSTQATRSVEPPSDLPRRFDRPLPAHLVGDLSITEWLSPIEARRMSRPSRFATVAALEALADAGTPPEPTVDPDLGTVVATTFGPVETTQKLLDQYLEHGPEFMSPAIFSECVANAPAAHVSLSGRAGGANLTVVQREAGPLTAVATAAGLLADGRAERCLAGAAEEMSPLLLGLLDGFGAVSPDRARPFDRNRDGYVPAEGASILCLETESRARRRGVTGRCRVVGAGAAFDPTSSSATVGREATRVGEAVRERMGARRIDPTSIDLVVSGASGSRAIDAWEALCLRALWSEGELPPVVAPKGATGEYGGFPLVAAVLLAQGDTIHPTLGFEKSDPDLGITPVTRTPGTSTDDAGPQGRRVLVTGTSAGGQFAWLVLEGPHVQR